MRLIIRLLKILKMLYCRQNRNLDRNLDRNLVRNVDRNLDRNVDPLGFSLFSSIITSKMSLFQKYA